MAERTHSSGADEDDESLDRLIDAMEQIRKANPEAEEKTFEESLAVVYFSFLHAQLNLSIILACLKPIYA